MIYAHFFLWFVTQLCDGLRRTTTTPESRQHHRYTRFLSALWWLWQELVFFAHRSGTNFCADLYSEINFYSVLQKQGRALAITLFETLCESCEWCSLPRVLDQQHITRAERTWDQYITREYAVGLFAAQTRWQQLGVVAISKVQTWIAMGLKTYANDSMHIYLRK